MNKYVPTSITWINVISFAHSTFLQVLAFHCKLGTRSLSCPLCLKRHLVTEIRSSLNLWRVSPQIMLRKNMPFFLQFSFYHSRRCKIAEHWSSFYVQDDFLWSHQSVAKPRYAFEGAKSFMVQQVQLWKEIKQLKRLLVSQRERGALLNEVNTCQYTMLVLKHNCIISGASTYPLFGHSTSKFGQGSRAEKVTKWS